MFNNSNDIIIGKLVNEDRKELEKSLIQQSYIRELKLGNKDSVFLKLVSRIGIILISSGEKLKKFADHQSHKNTQTLVTS